MRLSLYSAASLFAIAGFEAAANQLTSSMSTAMIDTEYDPMGLAQDNAVVDQTLQDNLALPQTETEKKPSFKIKANASPCQKACMCKKMKAAATVDGIRKGIVALQEAKIEARKR